MINLNLFIVYDSHIEKIWNKTHSPLKPIEKPMIKELIIGLSNDAAKFMPWDISSIDIKSEVIVFELWMNGKEFKREMKTENIIVYEQINIIAFELEDNDFENAEKMLVRFFVSVSLPEIFVKPVLLKNSFPIKNDTKIWEKYRKKP